ncbi:unnamed protein product, partial [Staurois parvus]
MVKKWNTPAFWGNLKVAHGKSVAMETAQGRPKGGPQRTRTGSSMRRRYRGPWQIRACRVWGPRKSARKPLFKKGEHPACVGRPKVA